MAGEGKSESPTVRPAQTPLPSSPIVLAAAAGFFYHFLHGFLAVVPSPSLLPWSLGPHPTRSSVHFSLFSRSNPLPPPRALFLRRSSSFSPSVLLSIFLFPSTSSLLFYIRGRRARTGHAIFLVEAPPPLYRAAILSQLALSRERRERPRRRKLTRFLSVAVPIPPRPYLSDLFLFSAVSCQIREW